MPKNWLVMEGDGPGRPFAPDWPGQGGICLPLCSQLTN